MLWVEKRWDELLATTALPYRTIPNANTGLSPSFLVTETEAVLPLSREWSVPSFDASGSKWLQKLWRCLHEPIEKPLKEVQRRKGLSKNDGYPVGLWVGIRAQTRGFALEGSIEVPRTELFEFYRGGLPTRSRILLVGYVRKSTADI